MTVHTHLVVREAGRSVHCRGTRVSDAQSSLSAVFLALVHWLVDVTTHCTPGKPRSGVQPLRTVTSELACDFSDCVRRGVAALHTCALSESFASTCTRCLRSLCSSVPWRVGVTDVGQAPLRGNVLARRFSRISTRVQSSCPQRRYRSVLLRSRRVV